MAAVESGKIRNVAVTGHRGTGKTSLVEALLFQAGETNRLGTIDAGSTVADWDDDEPASIVPRRFVSPAWKSSASTSEVLPVPRWPTTATLRIFPGSNAGMRGVLLGSPVARAES